MHNWTRPGGCKEQLQDCQAALEKHGANLTALHSDDRTTELCLKTGSCAFLGEDEYSGGLYDLAHPRRDPFPPPVICEAPSLDVTSR